MAGLNPQQRHFIAAYIGEANKNATEAARIAGYKQPGMHGHRLLKNDEINQAIEDHLAEVKRQGIALKQNRIDALVRRHELMEQVIAERAAHEWTADVPGGSTGLVVKQLKNVKHLYERDPMDPESEEHQIVLEHWESALDTGLLREMREHEKQTAQEVGEWTEKSEVLSSGALRFELTGMRVPLPATADGQ